MARETLIERGDSYETVSLRSYGTADGARRIQTANPGVTELTPGLVVTVPDEAVVADIEVGDAPGGVDEVAVFVGGSRFRFWESVTIKRSMDSIHSFELSAPFEPDNAGFRQVFQPFTYQDAGIHIGAPRLFTGTMVGVTPSLGGSNPVKASGYARPGVLNDVMMPASSFPIEWEARTLPEIARDVCGPFGIAVTSDGEPGDIFNRVKLKPTEKIYNWLTGLAQQRGQLLSNDAAGNLRLVRSTTTRATTTLEGSPRVGISPAFKPQAYYSDVTALGKAKPGVGWTGGGSSQYTHPNPLLRGVVRPLNFNTGDTFPGDAPEAARAKFGRMLANAAAYRVRVAGWRDSQGELWEPNTRVRLLDPRAMIYTVTEFLIRSVTMGRTASGDACELDCIFPGAFEGIAPEAFPWAQ